MIAAIEIVVGSGPSAGTGLRLTLVNGDDELRIAIRLALASRDRRCPDCPVPPGDTRFLKYEKAGRVEGSD